MLQRVSRLFLVMIWAPFAFSYQGLVEERVTALDQVNLSYLDFSSSEPFGFVAFDGLVYFIARTDERTFRYFQTDGTKEGTLPVEGLSTFRSDVNRSLPHVWRDGLYLSDGSKLWWIREANGTPIALWNGSMSKPIEHQGKLVYHDYSSNLFYHDGESETATWVTHFPLQTSGQDHIGEFIRFGDHLYTTVSSYGPDFTLWRINSLEERGSEFITIPDSYSSDPAKLMVVGDRLFIATRGYSNYVGLWVSDGTAEGTKKILFESNIWYDEMKATHNYIWFTTYSNENGYELMRTDGTYAGTKLFYDFIPGEESGKPQGLTVVGNQLFMFAKTPEGPGLFVIRDEEQEPELISKVEWDYLDHLNYFETRDLAKDESGSIYFLGGLNGEGGIWTSDGNSEGTRHIQELRHANQFFPYNDGYIVSGALGFGGIEPWFVQDRMITQLGDLYADDRGLRFSHQWTFPYKDKLLGVNAGRDIEVWISDGEQVETLLRRPKTNDVEPRVNGPRFSLVGDTVVFEMADETFGYQVWRTDGTPEGTTILRDETQDLAHTAIKAVSGNTLYVTEDFGDTLKLWRSDGSQEGTSYLFDLEDGQNNFKLFPDGRGGLFVHQGDANALELSHVSKDGVTLELLRDMSEFITSDLNVSEVHQFNGATYFTMREYADQTEYLWRSDGTVEGTVLLEDQLTAMSVSVLSDRILVQGQNGQDYYLGFAEDDNLQLYLTENDNYQHFYDGSGFDTQFFTARNQIFETDGTLEGTRSVYQSESFVGRPEWMVRNDAFAILGNFRFPARFELPAILQIWRVDLNSGVAERLQDIYANRYYLSSEDPKVLGDYLYFQGSLTQDGPSSLCRLSLSKGDVQTVEGLEDLNLQPFNLHVSGDRLFFMGTDSMEGLKLFSMEQVEPKEVVPVTKRTLGTWFPDVWFLAVDPIEDATYEWTVEGGATILGGEGSHRLRVRLPEGGQAQISVLITGPDGSKYLGQASLGKAEAN